MKKMQGVLYIRNEIDNVIHDVKFWNTITTKTSNKEIIVDKNAIELLELLEKAKKFIEQFC